MKNYKRCFLVCFFITMFIVDAKPTSKSPSGTTRTSRVLSTDSEGGLSVRSSSSTRSRPRTCSSDSEASTMRRSLSSEIDFSRGRSGSTRHIEGYDPLLGDDETASCYMRELKGHTLPASFVVVSSDASRIITGSRDTIVRVWDGLFAGCQKMFKAHKYVPTVAALSYDAKFVATGSEGGEVFVWNLTTGGIAAVMSGHSGAIGSIEFSRDGFLLLTASDDKTACVWDVKTGECLRLFEGHFGLVSTAALSVDATLVATGSADLDVRVWDVKTGKCIRVFQNHDSVLTSINFDTDNSNIITRSANGIITIWDIQTQELLHISQGLAYLGRIIGAKHGEPLVFSVSGDGTVQVLSTDTEETFVWDDDGLSASCVARNSDGTLVIAGFEDGSVSIWDAFTGRCLQASSRYRKFKIIQVAFGRKDACIIRASDEGDLFVQRLALNTVESGVKNRDFPDCDPSGFIGGIKTMRNLSCSVQ